MSLDGKYVFATVPMCILTSCSSVLMALGMFIFVKVMPSLISVMSPPPFIVCVPCLCIWWYSGVFLVLDFCVSFVSCIVMMPGWVLCTKFFRSSILFLIPFILI